MQLQRNKISKLRVNIISSHLCGYKTSCYSDLKERNIIWTMELDSGALV